MRKRLTWCGLASACVFSVGVLLTADAQDTGQVTVSVSTEAVGITITGGNLDFGGPHAGDVPLRAHPSGEIETPPVITNSGNVAIRRIEVGYDGPSGAEAMCDGGSWSAHSSSVGVDRFTIRVLAATDQPNFHSNSVYVQPGAGSGNAFHSDTLNPGQEAKLFLEMRTPQTSTRGPGGCTIGLTVTAAAS